MNVLLCTNGHPATWPALEYGIWLAREGRARACPCEITLLGVVETPARRPAVEELLEKAERKLTESAVPSHRRVQTGRPEKAIPVAATAFDLTVLGPMSSHLVWAHLFSRLLLAMERPLLYVTQPHFRMERLLLCTGGLRYAEGVIRVGGVLARTFGGMITLLHVVEPVTLEYPLAQEIKNHWQDILETDTPQARHLREALAILQEMGVEADVRVRHGPVVHEILREIREGDYDLVGVGSPYAARSLRRLYRPNVALEVAEAARRPVLIASPASSPLLQGGAS